MNFSDLKEKLASGRRLRVLFLNDLGFQYGAGMAQRRQMESFALMGHEVAGLCWQGGMESAIDLPEYIPADLWLGLRELKAVHVDGGLTSQEITRAIVQAASGLSPDMIVVGNLHGARWPLELLLELRRIEKPIVVYMHDFFLLTGRCAYPGDCQRYESGCDQDCPTQNEIPWVPSDRIAEEWQLRRRLFCGPEAIPLAVNSRWLLAAAKRAMPKIGPAKDVYLGLDERLFSPIDRQLARRLVGVPPDAYVVLGGAVNLSDRRKGWHIFQKVVARLKRQVHFLVFGYESQNKKGVQAVGLLRDFRKMPIVYSTADLFVGTSTEEAFGQTVMEASACGLPVVAFGAGGIPEVARDGVNARVVDEFTADALVEAIREIQHHPDLAADMGAAGRRMVESDFSLRAQGQRWLDYMQAL